MDDGEIHPARLMLVVAASVFFDEVLSHVRVPPRLRGACTYSGHMPLSVSRVISIVLTETCKKKEAKVYVGGQCVVHFDTVVIMLTF